MLHSEGSQSYLRNTELSILSWVFIGDEMTWNFADIVKGQVTQTILSTVLEGVGYRVRRLGVEELIPEIRGREGAKIRNSLPERLRFIPDLVVIEPDTGETYLVEVKFRRALSDSVFALLLREIDARRRHWPEAFTVMMVANAKQDRGYHQDYIRVIPPDLSADQIKQSGSSALERWEKLPHLQETFRRIFGAMDNQQIIDSITPVLRDLAKLEQPRVLDARTRRSRE
jgi:hypothetical protein